MARETLRAYRLEQEQILIPQSPREIQEQLTELSGIIVAASFMGTMARTSGPVTAYEDGTIIFRDAENEQVEVPAPGYSLTNSLGPYLADLYETPKKARAPRSTALRLYLLGQTPKASLRVSIPDINTKAPRLEVKLESKNLEATAARVSSGIWHFQIIKRYPVTPIYKKITFHHGEREEEKRDIVLLLEQGILPKDPIFRPLRRFWACIKVHNSLVPGQDSTEAFELAETAFESALTDVLAIVYPKHESKDSQKFKKMYEEYAPKQQIVSSVLELNPFYKSRNSYYLADLFEGTPKKQGMAYFRAQMVYHVDRVNITEQVKTSSLDLSHSRNLTKSATRWAMMICEHLASHQADYLELENFIDNLFLEHARNLTSFVSHGVNFKKREIPEPEE